jgi:hypothetical protein
MPVTINGLDGNPFTTRDVDGSPNNFVFTAHKLGFSGSYTTGINGDTLDLTGIAGLIPSSALPLQITESLNGGVGSFSKGGGYCQIEIGNALNNCKVKFFAAGGAEIGTQTYAAALIGIAAENIGISILWRKLTS